MYVYSFISFSNTNVGEKHKNSKYNKPPKKKNCVESNVQ